MLDELVLTMLRSPVRISCATLLFHFPSRFHALLLSAGRALGASVYYSSFFLIHRQATTPHDTASRLVEYRIDTGVLLIF